MLQGSRRLIYLKEQYISAWLVHFISSFPRYILHLMYMWVGFFLPSFFFFLCPCHHYLLHFKWHQKVIECGYYTLFHNIVFIVHMYITTIEKLRLDLHERDVSMYITVFLGLPKSTQRNADVVELRGGTCEIVFRILYFMRVSYRLCRMAPAVSHWAIRWCSCPQI